MKLQSDDGYDLLHVEKKIKTKSQMRRYSGVASVTGVACVVEGDGDVSSGGLGRIWITTKQSDSTEVGCRFVVDIVTD
jgi:hypothetical protein